MKCWPGCASVASTIRWYMQIDAARFGSDLSLRRRSATSSSFSNVRLKLHDLLHEAREEDGVARLVDLLRGEEVLLLLARRGVDVRREVVGHRVLAVEEQRVHPQRP